MSTRSATRIVLPTHNGMNPTYERPSVDLYRHCDGYPAESGGAILQALAAPREGFATKASALVGHLLAGEFGRYEITRNATNHGDLEYFYLVSMEPDQSVRVWVYARPSFADSVSDNPLSWPCTHCETLAELAALVNADREAINGRLDIMAKRQPEYAKYDRYEMLTA